VSTKMSLELIPHDGVNACMSVTIRLPLVGCCSTELVRNKKDFLVIRALGDYKFLLDSLKPIFGFHWVLGLGECGRVSSQEFPKPGLRWWWWAIVATEPGGSAEVCLVSRALLASAGFTWP
jgi:hypothetical protein